jgi:NTP pyrophosphatase (non-canonical NTP hydrolase)
MFENIVRWARKQQRIHPADEYQVEAVRTKGTRGLRETLMMCSFGLMGEVGEVIDEIKKVLFHNKPVDREKLLSELGDVLWYLAVVSNAAGIDLSEVMEYNVQKLKERYPHGWVEYSQRGSS